jgi:hypothetical protein
MILLLPSLSGAGIAGMYHHTWLLLKFSKIKIISKEANKNPLEFTSHNPNLNVFRC